MITDFRQKKIEQVFKTSIVQQTAFWSEVKKQMGIESLAFNYNVKNSDIYVNSNSDNYIISDVLVIIQQLGNENSIAYVPYGPELEPSGQNHGIFLEEMSEYLRYFLPKNCIMVRYDLAWESYWSKDADFYDSGGFWVGPPDNSIQELRFNFSTQKWNFKKSISNILPSNTVFLDLKQDLNCLLEAMKPKARYNLRLSYRKGVNVKVCGFENLSTWYKLYEETSLRNRLLLHDIEYFQTVLTTKTNNTQSPAEVFLLIAEFDDKPLAAMFLVISGNRGTYLYGASSSENKNLMASYMLIWKSIEIAKDKGCTEYDMFGLAPKPDPFHPLYGLYRFKIGFGGELHHSLGCWDYPYDLEKYKYFTALELKQKGYHIN
jgi:lipid II:glycine glycyltransferase (peptidoglycan interpeptide bridge formation enzyme)